VQMNFERGSSERPSGHALLYFRSATDNRRVLATYIVVPPIALNLTKYMPPFLAAHLPQQEMGGMSAFPLPPVAEPVESYEFLTRLAEARSDDLIFGGILNESDIERLIGSCSEAAQDYYGLYSSYIVGPGPSIATPPSQIMIPRSAYQSMSEIEKLGELAQLAGKARDAVGRSDKLVIDEAVREIQELAEVMPEKYQISRVAEVAGMPGEKGTRLAELYIDRCYRLYYEEYEKIADIQSRIEELEAAS
jgi:hypothetical protein